MVSAKARRSAVSLAILLAPLTAALAQENPEDTQVAFAMTESLNFSGDIAPLDLGSLGRWQVFGAASGLAFHQTYPSPGNQADNIGFTNAQFIVQKTLDRTAPVPARRASCWRREFCIEYAR